MMFSVSFLQWLVVGALVLCSIGVIMLVAFLFFDSRGKKIW
tara:strand:+ start:9953 stop:10075 length:123 start_codon:yes stop_codon:yes gene_type:complete